MTKRRIAVLKKESLAGLAEGWGDECYALLLPVTVGQLKTLKELDTSKLSEDDSVSMMLDFVRDHIGGGQIKVLTESDEVVLDKLTGADVEDLGLDFIVHLFQALTSAGAQFSDPKASSPTTGTLSTSTPTSAPDEPTTPTTASSSAA